MSVSERSRRVLLDCTFRGVPDLEGGCLLGVAVRGVLGLAPASVLDESRCWVWTVEPSLLLCRARTLGFFWVSSESSEPSGDAGTGSAKELCLTEFRLCALTRDQLVERNLSASSQNRTRWSAPRSSMKCMKCGIATLSWRACSTVLDMRERVSWGW